MALYFFFKWLTLPLHLSQGFAEASRHLLFHAVREQTCVTGRTIIVQLLLDASLIVMFVALAVD